MKKEGFREYYIDNLRNFTILLLFPVHTFMVWNDFGSKFYIWQGEQKGLSSFIVLVNPWFMPMLFVLAGISARHALGERTAKEFMAQRARKLLLPFVGGMAFLVPVQSFYARRFFEGYSGGYLAHLKFFFTHVTDFTGYDGAFTPGHGLSCIYLWFLWRRWPCPSSCLMGRQKNMWNACRPWESCCCLCQSGCFTIWGMWAASALGSVLRCIWQDIMCWGTELRWAGWNGTFGGWRLCA